MIIACTYFSQKQPLQVNIKDIIYKNIRKQRKEKNSNGMSKIEASEDKTKSNIIAFAHSQTPTRVGENIFELHIKSKAWYFFPQT